MITDPTSREYIDRLIRLQEKKDKNTHKWNLALEALYLWAEWFEKEGSPKIYGVAGVSCFFCKGAARPGHEIRHKPDCIYRRAKELVDEAKELPE